MNMSIREPKQPTVFVVDDDRQMRESLTALLSALGFPVYTFASGAEFRAAYDRDTPGCLLLDIRMPEEDGLKTYERMIHDGQRLPVIFITAHADVTTAVAAMKTGAIEFLEKPFDRQSLLELVRKAIELDAQWRRRDNEFASLDDRIKRLNSRERETLSLILAGESNKIIASHLFLSQRAVEMRRASIMRKLGVESLAELLDLALTHRILSEIRTAELHPQLR
jgi:FixJ family two-component response regulator